MFGRREFVKHGAAAAALMAVRTGSGPLWQFPVLGRVAVDAPTAARDLIEDPPAVKELLAAAVSAAQAGGAQYADVRIQRLQRNFVFTREQQILNVVDTDTLGCGVRALVDGTWGFAATRALTTDGVTAAARQAVATARASRAARDQRGRAGTDRCPHGCRAGPDSFTTDPWTIPFEQKTDSC